MIKVEPCKGCGGLILMDDFMGVRIRCDLTPLDAQTAGAAVLAGLELYRLVSEGGRPNQFASASMGELRALGAGRSPGLTVVAQHRCSPKPHTAVSRPIPAPDKETLTEACPKAQDPAQRAARGPSAEPATPYRSSEPVCDGCGTPMADGSYVSIELGDIMIWKHHVEACGN